RGRRRAAGSARYSGEWQARTARSASCRPVVIRASSPQNITSGSTAAENPQPTRIYATFGHWGTTPRRAHLDSPCKGANKTPLDQAAWPLACTAGLQGSLARNQDGEGPVRPPPPGGASESGAEAPCAPAQASRLRSLFASFRSRRGCG